MEREGREEGQVEPAGDSAGQPGELPAADDRPGEPTNRSESRASDAAADAEDAAANGPTQERAIVHQPQGPKRLVGEALQFGPPPGVGELVLLVLFTGLCDWLLYQGPGGLSYAILGMAGTVLIVSFAPVRGYSSYLFLFVLLQVLLAVRHAWQTEPWTLTATAVCLAGLAITVRSGRADIPFLATSLLPSLLIAPARLIHYPAAFAQGRRYRRRSRIRDRLIVWGVPLLVLTAFACIFVRSNLILSGWAGQGFDYAVSQLSAFWRQLDVSAPRVLFWLACLGLLGALLRPYLQPPSRDALWQRNEETLVHTGQTNRATAYRMAFNTLAGVNLLFLMYHAFDGYYLLLRQALPEGLNHSQFARQGALWLTVALAMSTAVLGAVFHGKLNVHPRLRVLLALAGLWIIQNLCLVGWVLMRLDMYIGYNGLTRMRIVGITGTLLVACGFLLVTLKVYSRRSVFWLLRKQLGLFALTLVLLSVFPFDAIAWWWNVRLIRGMDVPRPAVQLVEQPLSPEGLVMLPPLLEHDDPVIARGAAALMGRYYFGQGSAYHGRGEESPIRWTQYQVSGFICTHVLGAHEQRILDLVPDGKWQDAIDELRRHTAPWI